MVNAGTLFNIQRYSIHDGPGIRTIVFLKGCPLRCMWCSNPESGEMDIQLSFNRNLCLACDACMHRCATGAIVRDDRFGRRIRPDLCTMCGECYANCPGRAIKKIGKRVSVEEVVQEVQKDMLFYRKSGGGVTVSGGEPFVQWEFTQALLKACKARHISTAVETTGAVPFECMEPSLESIDLFLYDVKHMDSDMHQKFTGAPNRRILQNLRELNRRAKRIWVRVPLISGVNDSQENMEAVYALADSLEHVERVELLPYHAYGVGKYAQLGREYLLEGMQTPSEERISALVELAERQYPKLRVIVRRHE